MRDGPHAPPSCPAALGSSSERQQRHAATCNRTAPHMLFYLPFAFLLAHACRAEAPLLDALDEAFYSQLEAGSPKEYARLQKDLEALSQQAAALSVPNAYGALASGAAPLQRCLRFWRLCVCLPPLCWQCHLSSFGF